MLQHSVTQSDSCNPSAALHRLHTFRTSAASAAGSACIAGCVGASIGSSENGSPETHSSIASMLTILWEGCGPHCSRIKVSRRSVSNQSSYRKDVLKRRPTRTIFELLTDTRNACTPVRYCCLQRWRDRSTRNAHPNNFKIANLQNIMTSDLQATTWTAPLPTKSLPERRFAASVRERK